jgi:hypothetical protein
MSMDSFFDNAVFGVMPNLGGLGDGGNAGMGMGMGMGNTGNGGEEDLWQQLFGTYP